MFSNKSFYILLAFSRTGSTALENFFVSHDSFFHDKTRIPSLEIPPKEFIRDFFILNKDRPEKCLGFKCLYQQCDLDTIKSHILNCSNSRKIILYRKDVLHIALSKKIAEKTNQWHIQMGEEFKYTPPFRIDVDWLEDYIKRVKKTYQKWLDEAKEGNYIKVSYEDIFLKNTRKELEKIFSFLNVQEDVGEISFGLKRGNNRDTYKKLILNLDEIESHLKDIRYIHE